MTAHTCSVLAVRSASTAMPRLAVWLEEADNAGPHGKSGQWPLHVHDAACTDLQPDDVGAVFRGSCARKHLSRHAGCFLDVKASLTSLKQRRMTSAEAVCEALVYEVAPFHKQLGPRGLWRHLRSPTTFAQNPFDYGHLPQSSGLDESLGQPADVNKWSLKRMAKKVLAAGASSMDGLMNPHLITALAIAAVWTVPQGLPIPPLSHMVMGPLDKFKNLGVTFESMSLNGLKGIGTGIHGAAKGIGMGIKKVGKVAVHGVKAGAKGVSIAAKHSLKAGKVGAKLIGKGAASLGAGIAAGAIAGASVAGKGIVKGAAGLGGAVKAVGKNLSPEAIAKNVAIAGSATAAAAEKMMKATAAAASVAATATRKAGKVVVGAAKLAHKSAKFAAKGVVKGVKGLAYGLKTLDEMVRATGRGIVAGMKAGGMRKALLMAGGATLIAGVALLSVAALSQQKGRSRGTFGRQSFGSGRGPSKRRRGSARELAEARAAEAREERERRARAKVGLPEDAGNQDGLQGSSAVKHKKWRLYNHLPPDVRALNGRSERGLSLHHEQDLVGDAAAMAPTDGRRGLGLGGLAAVVGGMGLGLHQLQGQPGLQGRPGSQGFSGGINADGLPGGDGAGGSEGDQALGMSEAAQIRERRRLRNAADMQREYAALEVQPRNAARARSATGRTGRLGMNGPHRPESAGVERPGDGSGSLHLQLKRNDALELRRLSTAEQSERYPYRIPRHLHIRAVVYPEFETCAGPAESCTRSPLDHEYRLMKTRERLLLQDQPRLGKRSGHHEQLSQERIYPMLPRGNTFKDHMRLYLRSGHKSERGTHSASLSLRQRSQPTHRYAPTGMLGVSHRGSAFLDLAGKSVELNDLLDPALLEPAYQGLSVSIEAIGYHFLGTTIPRQQLVDLRAGTRARFLHS